MLVRLNGVSMRALRIVAAVVVMLSGAVNADDGAQSLQGKTKVWVTFEASESRGEAVYKTYCHHCHGPKGDGSGHFGRGLMVKPVDLTAPEAASRMTPQAIFTIVKNGSTKPNTAMIPWSSVLPDELIRDVSEYTAALAAEGRKGRLPVKNDGGR